MYHKVHVENSRNKVKGVISTKIGTIENDPAGDYDYDIRLTTGAKH